MNDSREFVRFCLAMWKLYLYNFNDSYVRMRVNEIKKDAVAMVADKRFVWARNATVALAGGIQQRLSRPGRYALADRYVFELLTIEV